MVALVSHPESPLTQLPGAVLTVCFYWNNYCCLQPEGRTFIFCDPSERPIVTLGLRTQLIVINPTCVSSRTLVTLSLCVCLCSCSYTAAARRTAPRPPPLTTTAVTAATAAATVAPGCLVPLESFLCPHHNLNHDPPRPPTPLFILHAFIHT